LLPLFWCRPITHHSYTAKSIIISQSCESARYLILCGCCQTLVSLRNLEVCFTWICQFFSGTLKLVIASQNFSCWLGANLRIYVNRCVLKVQM
jgi:hypothetical protein